jgi:RNase H-fold protein (predicted Holliday junction resolvase)
MILAIDPGKSKCGLAVLGPDAAVLEKRVVPRPQAPAAILELAAKYSLAVLVVGRSSFGKDLEKELTRLDLNASLVFISEKHSTTQARRRYWQENRPRGLWKMIPTSLRVPPAPVDDHAAVILGERYLKG